MNITLRREPSANGCTIGRLSIDGAFECYTCEDVARPGQPKVPGETAIPEGRYRIVITRSDRFSRIAGHDVLLPLLLDVPGFTGIRIHPGNTAADTEGCILPGRDVRLDGVGDSRRAFANLFAKIQAALAAGQDVWIDITQRQRHEPAGP